MIGVLLPSQ